jgi:sugar lactone lactonase YvrE
MVVLTLAAACGDDGTETPADAALELDAAPPIDEIALAGAWFYPESITATADGTRYVGSVATGEVVRIGPGATSAETFIAPGDPTNVTGLLADEAGGTLWVCAVNFGGQPTELRAYDLASAALERTIAVAGFCTDLARAPDGTLYVTDSAGGAVHRLAAGGAALETWFQDELLAPSSAGAFGANGIVVEDGGALVVTNMSKGTLVRVASDGSGAVAVPVTPALNAPDGLRLRADGSFLVVEAGPDATGRLTHVSAAGVATSLADGLRFPTSVVELDGDLWVTEGQLDELLKTLSSPPGTPEPVLPFLVKRFPAP